MRLGGSLSLEKTDLGAAKIFPLPFRCLQHWSVALNNRHWKFVGELLEIQNKIYI